MDTAELLVEATVNNPSDRLVRRALADFYHETTDATWWRCLRRAAAPYAMVRRAEGMTRARRLVSNSSQAAAWRRFVIAAAAKCRLVNDTYQLFILPTGTPPRLWARRTTSHPVRTCP